MIVMMMTIMIIIVAVISSKLFPYAHRCIHNTSLKLSF